MGFGSERRIQLGQIFFFTPSRVVAASFCTEFWMAAVVAASEARWGRACVRDGQGGGGRGRRAVVGRNYTPTEFDFPNRTCLSDSCPLDLAIGTIAGSFANLVACARGASAVGTHFCGTHFAMRRRLLWCRCFSFNGYISESRRAQLHYRSLTLPARWRIAN